MTSQKAHFNLFGSIVLKNHTIHQLCRSVMPVDHLKRTNLILDATFSLVARNSIEKACKDPTTSSSIPYNS